MRSVVIVGASLAGLAAAEGLRAGGHDGSVVVVGGESHLPYDRPPLSKQVLQGSKLPSDTALRSQTELDQLDIDWCLGVRASAVDVARRRLELEDGTTLAFDGLVIATGARPRRIAAAEPFDGVHVLRTLDDCISLRAALNRTPRRAVVIGAGFIGLEVAATLRSTGVDVTVLEALAWPLARIFGPTIGSAVGNVHREHGVDLRCGVSVVGFEGAGRVERLVLSDGSTIDTDLVIVGIGVTPETTWLDGSGLALDDGVVCDATCAAAPGVVAAGDVARWPSKRYGTAVRIEHWDNALNQGRHAGRRLLGHTEVFDPVPYVWSDQYDRKLQLTGSVSPDDVFQTVEGSLDEDRFCVLFGRNGRVTGVLTMNRAKAASRYRRLIAEGTAWDAALVASPDAGVRA